MEREPMGDRERVCLPVRRGDSESLQRSEDERLRRRVRERVDDGRRPRGGLEEGAIRVARLRPERRVHHDSVRAPSKCPDIAQEETDPGVESAGVFAGDGERARVRVDRDDAGRPEEGGPNRENARSTSEVGDPSARDVALRKCQPEGVRGDRGGGLVLLRPRRRRRMARERFQRDLEAPLPHGPAMARPEISFSVRRPPNESERRIPCLRRGRPMARFPPWRWLWSAIITFVLTGPAMELAGRVLIRG